MLLMLLFNLRPILVHVKTSFFADAGTVPLTWRDRLIGNRWVQRILRLMVVVAVGAIMGDGVLTPAISGMTLPFTCSKCHQSMPQWHSMMYMLCPPMLWFGWICLQIPWKTQASPVFADCICQSLRFSHKCLPGCFIHSCA